MIARALHLIDPPGCGWPALALLAGIAGRPAGRIGHDLLVVGGTDARGIACRFGLDARDGITPPLSRISSGSRLLARILASRSDVDFVVPWSIRTMLLAARAMPKASIVPVLSLPPPPIGGAIRWMPFARNLRQSALVVYPSAFLRDSWVARFTLLGCPSAVIPAAPRNEHAPNRRAELREQWGAPDDAIVIAALGEPEEAIDAHAAVFATGVLGVAGRSAIALVPPKASNLDRGLRFAARIRPSRRVVVDERPPADLLEGADMVLWSEPAASGARGSVYTTPLGAVSLAWAAAMGVPIVAHEHPAWRSVLGGYDGVIPVADRTRLRLTHAILRMLDAPSSTPIPGSAGWAEAFDAQLASLHRAAARRLVG